MRKLFIISLFVLGIYNAHGQDSIPSYFNITDTTFKINQICIFRLVEPVIGDWVSTPNPLFKPMADSIIKFFNDNPTTVIEISVHTDYKGGYEYNDTLTYKKAKVYSDYFIMEGILVTRIIPQGYGERQPRYVTKELASLYPFLKQGTFLSEETITTLETPDMQKIACGLNKRIELKIIKK